MQKTAVIAMSGGVDSSTAAFLMKEAGYSCIGMTMKLFEKQGGVPSRDADDAKKIADALGMPFHVVDFQKEFAEEVIARFVRAYEQGQTPNPCVDCNRYLKFGTLDRAAAELGGQMLVTGHYAKIAYDEQTGRYLLKKAIDPSKDQSYFLYSLTQEQLARTRFPLGELNKPQVREIAESHGLITAHKSESQDICFVENGKYAEFIESYLGKAFPPGDFIDCSGKVLGQHKGIIRYTIGQRKGLGLSFSEPMYVCKVNPADNTVTLGKNEDLFSRSLLADHLNLISVSQIEQPLRTKARVRYRQQEQWATVTQTAPDQIRVDFDEPQRAITAGQAVVLYDDDTVVGGGTIQTVF